MTPAAQARTLDAEIAGVIERWHRSAELLDDATFDELALRLFAYQFRHNAAYARYCSALGVTEPTSWEEIPAVPAAAFKETALVTFDPAKAALVFETSGTTRGAGGLHYMETAELYDAALLAGFDRFVLPDAAQLRYFNLVPNPADGRRSSLGYMMAQVARERGSGPTGWYLRGDELLVDAFAGDVRAASERAQPVCIAATAFALVHLLDAMERRAIKFTLAAGSRIMETGGLKGRARAVGRDELYARLRVRFGVTDEAIVCEYGMTELTSQYYARAGRAYSGPPWLRTRVVGPQRRTLPNGEAGALLHVDLANRSSCIAIVTDDLGVRTDDGLVLIGRDAKAPARGCSLDAEELDARSGLETRARS